MSALPAMETYTVRDYLQWAGDWELIHGQPVAMAPSPAVEHQTASFAIAHQLGENLQDCPHCQALFEIDVELSDDTVVRPDVLVICYQPEGDRLTRAPDLIFEVVSPKSARRDEVVKFELYRQEGVAHYVLVYPEAKKAKVWRLMEGEYRKQGDFHDESHRFDLSKCSLDFDFSRLWKRKGGQ
jgi:Uma2 family endonuclease